MNCVCSGTSSQKKIFFGNDKIRVRVIVCFFVLCFLLEFQIEIKLYHGKALTKIQCIIFFLLFLPSLVRTLTFFFFISWRDKFLQFKWRIASHFWVTNMKTITNMINIRDTNEFKNFNSTQQRKKMNIRWQRKLSIFLSHS